MMYYIVVPNKERKGVYMNKRPYNKLKGYLAENEIKNKDVAKLLGVTETSFSKKINRNGQDFTADQIRTLCNKYKLDANKFFLL